MATYIVNSGVGIAIARLRGQRVDTTAQPEPLFVAWGTAGVPNTQKTDTGLSTEAPNFAGMRITGVGSIQTSNPGTSPNNDTWQCVATLTAEIGKTITNAGSFDAVTTGNLFIKGDFSGIALNTGDSIQFTLKAIAASG